MKYLKRFESLDNKELNDRIFNMKDKLKEIDDQIEKIEKDLE